MTARSIPDASVIATWRKSSYSGSENADCVEFARLGNEIATRDSKNPAGPALVFSRDAWTSFIRGVVSGGFDNA